ncbi:gag-pol polyprotein, partial [Trifolium medium]|nr:gag-pol polyprotein [Trifolium medium]
PHMDKSKYCHYHRSYGHVTEDCIHLKDSIEILIQKGYARKYVKEGDSKTNEAQMAIDAPATDDEENRT